MNTNIKFKVPNGGKKLTIDIDGDYTVLGYHWVIKKKKEYGLYTKDAVNQRIKELKAELYNPINRRPNGKPYAKVADIQVMLADLKKLRGKL